MNTINTVEWAISTGLVPYPLAVRTMEQRVTEIASGKGREGVWLLEHPSLYTAGTSAKAEDLLEARFPVFKSGRGGQYTYHGPGQRVAYVMLDLNRRGRRDVRLYVRDLEEWLMRTLGRFGVKGERRAGRVGIWVTHDGREDKIAAIGVRLKQWVTYHGVSLNVDPDLSHFSGIVPCGIAHEGLGVTSLSALGVRVSLAEADTALEGTFTEIFGAVIEPPEMQQERA